MFLTVAILAGGVAAPAWAWGPLGHQVVADVAGAHVKPKTKTAIRKLLKHGTMASVASWADVVRDDRPETYNWHFVDIEVENDTYVAERDCKPTEQGDCAVAAIERLRKVLADKTAKPAKRAEALRFLIHLVGDIHQPLHCADHNDRGGNAVQVKFCGEATNLHRTWDSAMIHSTSLSEAQYRDHVEGYIDTLDDADIAQLQSGGPVTWVVECHKAAVKHAYKVPADKELCGDYTDKNLAIVDKQLARASLRLAKVLDDALGK